MSAAPFSATRFESARSERALGLGSPLHALASTGSTSDDALAAARAGAPHGSLWVAEHQTAGRGRRGNRWQSAPGENLLFSLLLRPDLPPERLSPLTLLVGLAVRAACARRVSVALKVKWPNDVVAGQLKLAGILVETTLQHAARPRVEAVVVGVGVNVASSTLPSEVATSATSLALLGATELAREPLLADVLTELELRLDRFQSHAVGAILPELRQHDALFGRAIAVDGEAGVARGLTESGALLLERPDGRLEPRHSGTVSW